MNYVYIVLNTDTGLPIGAYENRDEAEDVCEEVNSFSENFFKVIPTDFYEKGE